LVASFLATNSYATPKLIKENVFVFRILSDVYSLNKLKNFAAYISEFSCMYEGSLLVKSTGLNRRQLAKVRRISSNKSFSKTNLELYEKMRVFIKVIKYLETQRVSVNLSLYSALKESARVNKCRLVFKGEFTPLLREMIKSEVYFQSRFQKKNFGISELELSKVMKSYPGKSRKNVRKIEEALRRATSIAAFLKSIEKQVNHEVFY
jgi:hypothetical protein